MQNIQEQLRQRFSRRFVGAMVDSPRGRAFVLSSAADAEGSDEGRIFDELTRLVDDPELKKLIRIHKADEERHAEMFSEAARRTGASVPLIPERLRFLPRLERNLGGVFDDLLADGTELGIMRAYVLLQVIEERAVTQFGILGPALAKVDSFAAEVVEQIAADEDRHLKYCRAISRRYAPSERELRDTLAHYRRVEAISFGEQSRAVLRHALDHELIDVGPARRWLLLHMARVGDRRRVPVPTPFAGQAPVRA